MTMKENRIRFNSRSTKEQKTRDFLITVAALIASHSYRENISGISGLSKVLTRIQKRYLSWSQKANTVYNKHYQAIAIKSNKIIYSVDYIFGSLNTIF